MVEKTIDIIYQLKADLMAKIIAQFLQTLHYNNSRLHTKVRLWGSDLSYQCLKLKIQFMHPSGADAQKSMHSDLKYCAH